jgi:hypothetical protein
MNKQASGRKDYDPASSTQVRYSGKTPSEAISSLDYEAVGLVEGTAFLTLHIRDGKLARWHVVGEGSYTEGGYSGKTTVPAVIALERRLAGLEYGTATLTLHVKDGELWYTTGKESSRIPEAGDDE